MKITIKPDGNYSKTTVFLSKLLHFNDRLPKIKRLAEEGVRALKAATPKDSGITADSWDYILETGPFKTTITWTNSSKNGNFPIAIMLQYGHGTGEGGYVKGVDYINPAIKPVFDKISDEVWKEVKTL